MRISLQGPLKYIQDKGLIKEVGGYARKLGGKALVLISSGGELRFGDVIRESFCDAKCPYEICIFSGDANYEEIERVAKAAVDAEAAVVIGLGGGRVLDTARAAADNVGCALIIVPTTASNDAPCSAVAVIHDENGKTVEVRTVSRNPDLVLMDTEIIAAAPTRFLSAGIGDAIATYFEARANVQREQDENSGNISTRTALAMSRLCYDIMLEFGPKAVEDAGRGEISYALEQVIHAASFLSGYGFENGGVAAAHAVNEGFSVLPRCSGILHGELVGFGVLIQLELEKAAEEEKDSLRDFMKKVGLSVNLEELGLEDLSEEELRLVAKEAAAAPPMKNMPFEISEDDIYRAIIAADK